MAKGVECPLHVVLRHSWDLRIKYSAPQSLGAEDRPGTRNDTGASKRS